MYVPSFLFLFVWFCFYHLSGFCFFVFFGIFLIFFTEMTNGWWGLGPWPEVGPEPLMWEHQVQNSRLSENSWPQWVMISERSHEGLYPNIRTTISNFRKDKASGSYKKFHRLIEERHLITCCKSYHVFLLIPFQLWTENTCEHLPCPWH